MSTLTTTATQINWALYLQPGKFRIVCPICGRGPKDKNLGLTRREDGFGLAHCFRCNFSEYDIPQSRREYKLKSLPRVASGVQRIEERPLTGLSNFGQAIWSQCLPIEGVAADYLHARSCRIPPKDSHLKWHPHLKHCTGHVGPALVALITHIQTGKSLSLHRTWITSTRKEQSLDNRVRMLLPNHPTTDGVIRLWPDNAIQTGLGIGEGIETCLSIGNLPVWCTLDASHLAKFPLLDRVEDLYIARDRDRAGEQAAEACAARWSAAGRRVWMSAQTSGDLNDLAQRRAA